MPLTYEHVGSKKPAKINTNMLTRAALLITLCYEIPCTVQLGRYKVKAKYLSTRAGQMTGMVSDHFDTLELLKRV